MKMILKDELKTLLSAKCQIFSIRNEFIIYRFAYH
jgi:hypothetical protein